MGWTNTQPDELTAPGSVPFLPGNNVTGIGNQVPAELSAAGYPNAIVFYASDWNPAATTPTVKFRFIAAHGSDETLVAGYGICMNPSVSQTATVEAALAIGAMDVTGSFMSGNWPSDRQMWVLAGVGTDAQFAVSGDANPLSFGAYLDAMADGTGFFIAGDTSAARGFLELGNTALVGAVGSNPVMTLYDRSFGTTATLIRDSGWTNIPLASGWSSDSNNPARYRMFPDGEVRLRGHVNKSTAPASGDAISTALPTAYRPSTYMNFLAPASASASGSQKVSVETDGTIKVFHPVAGVGDVILSPVRYPAGSGW